MRDRMAKTGTAAAGVPLWSEEELAVLRRHYPDYQAAIRALGGRRSYRAVRAKAQALGLTPKRNHWTGDQVVLLRRVFRSGTTADIFRAFPSRSENSIRQMAAYFNIRRPRKPFTPTGIMLIDQIRQKCFECALSMADLDEMAGTGTYFSKAGWHNGTVNPKKVAKAVKALGGQLVVRWDEGPDGSAVISPLPRSMPTGRLGVARPVHLAA